MAITAAMVKELRTMTGAGMMDAKRALTETQGDQHAAIDWLRTKGLAKAAKKSGRIAAEGLVAVRIAEGRGVIIEVNTETDFVGKNAEFQQMVATIAQAAIGAETLDELAAADLGGKTTAEQITEKIATIGENISLRRMAVLTGAQLASYVHNATARDMGKIAVLVALRGGRADFGKQVAMHIAATNPQALSAKTISPTDTEKERRIQLDILREDPKSAGKPQEILEKMIAGRMRKWVSEITLLGQKFVINPEMTVEAAAQAAGAEIIDYVRMEVGEGIEKKQEDFAAEVAKAAKE